MIDAELSLDELATVGRLALFHADPESRRRMIAVAKGQLDEKQAFKRLLFLGGPNDGWLETGRQAEGTLWVFASGGTPAIGQRIHAAPRYGIELMQHGIDHERQRELGLRLEQAVYQLESVGDPIIARFLGWYSELHDEQGNHIEPAGS